MVVPNARFYALLARLRRPAPGAERRAAAPRPPPHGGGVGAGRRRALGPAGAAHERPPLRLGLVGCGRLAELGYVAAARAAPSVEIVAVADPDRTRRGVVAGKLGVPGHARLGELLAATPLDGLVVCTPAEQHEEVAALAAQAGLTALVEKPPAPDAAGALRIAALRAGAVDRVQPPLRPGPAAHPQACRRAAT